MRRSLSRRILAWSAAGMITIVTAILMLVDSTFRASVRGDVQDGITATTQLTVVVANGRVTAASARLAPEAVRALERLAQARPVESTPRSGAHTPRRIVLEDESYLVAGVPLLDANGRIVGEVINLRSLSHAQAPVRRLRAWILALALLGLLLAALSSWLLSRSVTGPVDRLLDHARRMGDGDLDQPVPAAGDDEIGALARGFENMRSSLRDARERLIRNERLSAIGRTAGALVHDFAQPVTVLMGHLQLLDGEKDEGARQESMATMRSELERLRAMMGEILEFTRGEKHLVRMAVSVPAMIEGIVHGSAPALGRRGISLTTMHGFDGEWPLDAQRMSRVLHHLIGNAAAAIGRNGEIVIRTTRTGDALRIAVSDTGPGIPAAIRDTLFEPFVTGSRGGTGLGLAIVRNIIERQDGTIRVATGETGTTFVMEIPAMASSGSSAQTLPAAAA